MTLSNPSVLPAQAMAVLQKAASPAGIKASAQVTDNYDRVWARDSVVAGLAIMANELTGLYPAFRTSLVNLQKAAAPNGHIPSNVLLTDSGELTSVSFGGPVGRTDSSFWWIIGALVYLKKVKDQAFQSIVQEQCNRIFLLAEAWEFNYKGLMYLPVSGNWADEFVTGGYTLYDQLLRCWALSLAGAFYEQPEWTQKAEAIKIKIKQHYCLEAELDGTLFTTAQKEKIKDFDLTKDFICSFSPTQLINRYDCWSIGLLLLLRIPSAATVTKLKQAMLEAFEKTNHTGLPAFWPSIEENDSLFQQLQFNHHYRFKNKPGHFHNGGIWPVTNGFVCMALFAHRHTEEGQRLLQALEGNLVQALPAHPFTEYFDGYEGKPHGVTNLCFSAAGYLLAHKASGDSLAITELMGIQSASTEPVIQAKATQLAREIVNRLPLTNGVPVAISIAGESGCGKTTLGSAMQTVFQEKGYHVLLLHQDDYFKLPPRQNHERRLIDFDHIGPGEVRLDLLDEHIRQVKSKEVTTLTVPVMNWVTDVEEQTQVSVPHVDIIIVDGTYTSLLRQIDYRVFMSATYLQTRQNRVNRNRETVTDFIEKVLTKESAIIQSHRTKADVMITPDFTLENNPV